MKPIDVASLISDIDPTPAIKKLKDDKKTLVQRVDQLKLQLGNQEDFFSQILDHIDIIDKPKLKIIKSEINKITNPISMVTIWSDWHIGERIEMDEVECFNEYNLDVAKKRVEHLVTDMIDWVNVKRTVANIDEAVIICVGDFISGDIHEELKRTNEFPTPVQCVEAGYLIAEAISKLSENFPKVRVEFFTHDNHSRLTVKYQFKQGGLNSYNYIIGTIAKLRLQKHTNVEFNFHTSEKNVVSVKDYNYLCCHGHNIKGWAGFPYYGIDRLASKESKRRKFNLEKQFHKLIIGHFHSPLNSLDWIINGSLSGTSELDHACGRYSPPCQVAWFVHPKNGECDWNSFWC